MRHLQLLECVHALMLITLCWKSVCRLSAGAVQRLSATFSRLHSETLCFSTSLALGAAVEVLPSLRKMSRLPAEPKVADDRGGHFDRIVRRALAATLGLAALASLPGCSVRNEAVGNEATSTTNPPLPVNITTLAPEPYELGGKHYTVSWLGKETRFSVTNPGKETRGRLELQLATFGKPHTAELLSAGRVVGGPFPISHIFWQNGAEIVRFSVTLTHGENEFVLTSKETPNELPGGRQVCFLLVGKITAVSTSPGKP